MTYRKPRIWYTRGIWYCHEKLYFDGDGTGLGLTLEDAYLSWFKQITDGEYRERILKDFVKPVIYRKGHDQVRKLSFIPHRGAP